jgi:hypothetical protein
VRIGVKLDNAETRSVGSLVSTGPLSSGSGSVPWVILGTEDSGKNGELVLSGP